jgi:high-affinity iron transporter
MLSTLIITLREGLEAALIVGILIAYAVRTERRHLIRPIWWGVISAVAASLLAGALLSYTSTALPQNAEPVFAGSTSIIAVALVTWMIFWMKRTARNLRDELSGKMEKAALGGVAAIAMAAFLATAREGLETALFIYTNFKTVGAGSGATLGLVLGFTIAIALGVAIYRRSVHLNLGKFFTYTGVALIVIAAGVLANGFHEFQDLGWIGGGQITALDLSRFLHEGNFLEALLHGTLGLSEKTTALQLGIWVSYVALVAGAYLKPAKAVAQK